MSNAHSMDVENSDVDSIVSWSIASTPIASSPSNSIVPWTPDKEKSSERSIVPWSDNESPVATAIALPSNGSCVQWTSPMRKCTERSEQSIVPWSSELDAMHTPARKQRCIVQSMPARQQSTTSTIKKKINFSIPDIACSEKSKLPFYEE